MVEVKNNLVFATATTAKSAVIQENGIMIGYTLVLPNFTTAVSGILTIKDKDGATVYTGASHNENATYTVMSLTVPIDHGYTATLTLNAGAGGDHTASVKLYIQNK